MDVRKGGCYSADGGRAVTWVSEMPPPNTAEPDDPTRGGGDTPPQVSVLHLGAAEIDRRTETRGTESQADVQVVE